MLKFSHLELSEIKGLFKEINIQEDTEVQKKAQALLAILPESISKVDDLQDQNIIYYLAGYASRSIGKHLKCESCAALIIKDRNAPQILFDEANQDKAVDTGSFQMNDADLRKQFIKKMDRGGLCYPTDLSYIISVHSWKFFSDIEKASTQAKAIIYEAKRARHIFIRSVLC